MRVGPLFILCAALAGCAAQPAGPGERPEAYRARVHTELAAQYFSRGNPAVALQGLNTALQADPDYAPAYNMLGLVYGRLGEDASAERNFEKSLRLVSDYPEARNNYGHFLCQRGRYAEALTQFDAALKNPLYATPENALANAGLCALLAGDRVAAEGYLRRALARSPVQRLAIRAMAEWHLLANNPHGARAGLARLQEAGPLDAAETWLALRIERGLGNVDAGDRHADQLKTRFPEARETGWLMNGEFHRLGGLQ